jgi:hypothetical protein
MASPLQWQIANSQLPANLKLTVYGLAVIAAPPAFTNIFVSKAQLGAWTGRSERIAAEDMADLVTFGVLAVVERSKGGRAPRPEPGRQRETRSTRYQIVFERLQTWNAEDTKKLLEMRRSRRERPFGDGKENPDPRIRVRRSDRKGANPDPRIRPTMIRGSEEPGSADQTIRTTPDELIDPMDGAGDRPPDHAVEHQAAGPAEPSGRSPRSDGPAFRLLCEHGRRLMAGWGSGPVDWSELRSELRSAAFRQNFASDLVERVESFLEIQHKYHQENRL